MNDAYFLELLRYIHLNPVRAGIVDDPALWPWSGHVEYLGRRGHGILDLDFPLSLFANRGQQARRSYEDFVCDEAAEKTFDSISGGVIQFPNIKTTHERCAIKGSPSLTELANQFCEVSGIHIEEMRGPTRRREVSAVRRDFILRAVESVCRQMDIARFLNRSHAMIYKAVKISGYRAMH